VIAEFSVLTQWTVCGLIRAFGHYAAAVDGNTLGPVETEENVKNRRHPGGLIHVQLVRPRAPAVVHVHCDADVHGYCHRLQRYTQQDPNAGSSRVEHVKSRVINGLG